MKIKGRWGQFTPKPRQAAFYAARVASEKNQRRKAAIQRADWLEKHSACANGCGQPVAFYDEIHFALKFGGCCSAQCEAKLSAARTAGLPGVISENGK